MRHVAIRVLVAIVLAAVALAAIAPAFDAPVRWTPDGLYYQARVLELRGADPEAALAATFGGAPGAELRRIAPDKVGDPDWVTYNQQFYERRQSVPWTASVLEPLWGERAILNVSIAGYVVSVLAIFALLLLRFRVAVAGAATLATIFLPALTGNSELPLTDSWGLALTTGALLGALLTLDRGARWLPLWIVAIAALSFTRDTIWIPLLAVAVVAWWMHSRPAWTLLGTGFAAALPSLLLFTVPVRELLALGLNDHQPDPGASWGSIVQRMPDAIVEYVRADVGFVTRGAWYSGLYLALGVLALFLLSRRSRDDVAPLLLKAAAAVALLYMVAVPVFSALRLELVFVPMAAFGLACLAQRLGAVTAFLISPDRKFRLSPFTVLHDLRSARP